MAFSSLNSPESSPRGGANTPKTGSNTDSYATQGLLLGILTGELLSVLYLVIGVISGALGGGLKLAILYGFIALCSGSVILLLCTGLGAITGKLVELVNQQKC